MEDVLLTGGGIIPPNDAKKLHSLGVGEIFPPGTGTQKIVSYINSWVQQKRNFTSI